MSTAHARRLLVEEGAAGPRRRQEAPTAAEVHGRLAVEESDALLFGLPPFSGQETLDPDEIDDEDEDDYGELIMASRGAPAGRGRRFERTPGRRDRLKTELFRALEQGKLRLAYQPIVRLSDGSVAAFEALLRWPDPVLGVVSPEELIPVAEETGLIVPLTNWVIAESCWRLGAWLSLLGPDDPGFSMHVNVSNSCLLEPRFAARLRAALAINEIPGSRLVVELTESFCVDPRYAGGILEEIRGMGVRVALDDFGTGYSSLGCLQQLPIDILKIDRSFVARLGGSESPEVLRTILALGERLGIEVIAEGVETPAQLTQLRGLGCALAQGYLFANPCEPEVARELTHGELLIPP